MRIGSRQTEPSEGWFQIGDASDQLARPRRGYGRVSLAGDGAGPDGQIGTERFLREPLVERANAAAEGVLARVIRVRYGALALCGAVLLLVVLLVASRISSQAGHRAGHPRANTAQLHRDQTQIAQLSAGLRSSQQKLHVAQDRLLASRQTPVQARHRARPRPAAKHRSREGGK